MKRLIAVTVLSIVVLIILTGCQNFSAKFSGDYDAELLMPGNTLVVGKCTDLVRLSNGWMKVKINGTWYACTEWRVVLKDGD